jgi:small-conductance mechanosensitive channel
MNTDSIIETINQLINDLFTSVIRLAPRLILAILILLIGLVLAWAIKKLIRKFIFYLDRNINEKLRNQLLVVDLKSSAIFVSKTFYWIIIILAIAIVTQILGMPILTAWFGGVITYLPNILAAIVIVFTGIITGKLVGDLIASAASRTGISKGEQLGKFVRYIFLIISILIAIDQIGIDIQLLTIILTIILAALLFGAALAFGLGAQTSVRNILGSYYVQKTYKEGNTIQIGEIEGIIIKITPTAVFIETKLGQVMIPAKDFNEEKTILIKDN